MMERQEVCVVVQKRQDDDIRWLLMLLRRIGMLMVTEIDRRLDLPPSLLTKDERERRKRQ